MRACFPELLKEFDSLCSVAKAMLSLMERDVGWDHRLFSVGEHRETEVLAEDKITADISTLLHFEQQISHISGSMTVRYAIPIR